MCLRKDNSEKFTEEFNSNEVNLSLKPTGLFSLEMGLKLKGPNANVGGVLDMVKQEDEEQSNVCGVVLAC